LPYNSKTRNYTKYLRPLLKSWLKNLSSEYIYAEQIPNRTWDMCLQSWSCRSQRRETFSLKFWLWRQVPKKWQITRGFMFWRFLSWGIDYRTEIFKSCFEESLFWILTTLFPTVTWLSTRKFMTCFVFLSMPESTFLRWVWSGSGERWTCSHLDKNYVYQ
jgi:hypothetical protein